MRNNGLGGTPSASTWKNIPFEPTPRTYAATSITHWRWMRAAQFFPTLYTRPSSDPAPKVLKQVWFRGARAAIGGGYTRRDLSDIPLGWMMGPWPSTGWSSIPAQIKVLYRTRLRRLMTSLSETRLGISSDRGLAGTPFRVRMSAVKPPSCIRASPNGLREFRVGPGGRTCSPSRGRGARRGCHCAAVPDWADHRNRPILYDGTNTVAKKGGDGIGYSGHKHQRG